MTMTSSWRRWAPSLVVPASLLVLALACDGNGGSTPATETPGSTPSAGTPGASATPRDITPPEVQCVEVEAVARESSIALDQALPLGRIAFVSFRDEFEGNSNREIYLIGSDGSGPTNLTRNSCADDEPDWAPDGSKIAWESDRDGDFEIWVMDADGGNPTQLTTSGGLAPRWSNGGDRIAYTRGAALTVMNADGSDQRVILDPAIGEDRPCASGGFPGGWSPEDDRVIYYATVPQANSELGLGVICTVDVESGALEEIVRQDGVLNVEPVWSPDGGFIAYRSIQEGNSDIYVMDLATRTATKITDFEGLDTEPDWSPDGEWIVFGTNREAQTTDIYVMRSDGSDLRRLTDDEAKDSYPVWAP
ncbi:MAG: DPP IV N-terminal domain-containing protein [Dehalococcoidia bacterium]